MTAADPPTVPPGPPRSLGEHAKELPGWVGFLGAGAVVLVAAIALGAVRPEHRLAAGAALAVSVLPWVVGLLADAGSHQAAHAAVTLSGLAVLNVGGPRWAWFESGSLDQISLFIAVWLVGQVTSLGTGREGVATWLAAIGVIVARGRAEPAFDAVGVWVAGVTVALMAGLLIRLLGRTIIELKATQAELAREAVDAERRRIARDIHDVVAHTLSVTLLHLTAARLAVHRDDRDAAVEALEEAERAGRASLTDVRRTVGLLRDPTAGDGPGQAVSASLPSVADLDDLVASWQAAGLEVELHTAGDLSGVGPTVGLAVYRITQEALSNAARHLPGGRTRVDLDLATREAVVVIESTGLAAVAAPTGPGAGMGIRGMQERAGALGGTVHAGPTTAGWRVTARLPLADTGTGDR